MTDDLSEEEIFGRPLDSIPLDDLIAELQARRKEGPEVWLALRKMMLEQIVEFAQRPDDAPKWTDEWVKENTWDLVTADDDVEITDGSGNVFDDLGINMHDILISGLGEDFRPIADVIHKWDPRVLVEQLVMSGDPGDEYSGRCLVEIVKQKDEKALHIALAALTR